MEKQTPEAAINYASLYPEAEKYVEDYIARHHRPELLYHNLEHTRNVTAVARKLGEFYRLSAEDLAIVSVAALFHDTGYPEGYENHEERGARLATTWLEQKKVSPAFIRAVTDCILSTQLPQKPAGLLQQILCDADLAHFAANDFWDRSKLLRKEINSVKHLKLGKDEWNRATLQLLETHHYWTGYCREQLQKGKERNAKKLRKKIAEAELRQNPITALIESHNPTPLQGKLKEGAEERPERTIQTMFRITSGNSQRLSDQADTKAHIMISVNSIIISVLLSVLVRRMDEHAELTVPVIMILVVNLVTIVFSILATRPNIPGGTFSEADVLQKRVNLLFFGNFYRMSFEDYSQGMTQVMNDKDFLDTSLLRDVYSQGIILGRKYRMLKVAYNVFMYGLIVSTIVFFIAARWQ